MNKKSNFGKNLSNLLEIANIRRGTLAQGINVHPSVVSRWITGKREISYKSNYLELISNYLANNDNIIYNANEVLNMARKLNISINSTENIDLKQCIYSILVSSQGNHYDNRTLNTNTILTDSLIFKNFEIITGHKRILEAGIKLLTYAISKSYIISDPILITFFSEIGCFCSFDDFSAVINKALQNGLQIQNIVRLSENTNRNVDIIKKFLSYLNLDGYYPLYINNSFILHGPVDYIIIPNVGALVCIKSQNSKTFDNAFLIKDSHAAEILKKSLLQYSNHWYPLINSYCDFNQNVLSEIVQISQTNADRFSVVCDFNFFTLPQNFIEKYISNIASPYMNNISKIRENFHNQIKKYKFYDICSKKSIRKLIETRNYKMIKATPEEVIEHIQYVIYLLETYDNYNIALLDDTQIDNWTDASWFVKDFESVFIKGCDEFGCEKYITIYEPTTVHSFKSYFFDLLNKIPPINKDKSSVIAWLKNQIKIIQA